MPANPDSTCILSVQPTADEVFTGSSVGLTGMLGGTSTAGKQGAGEAIPDITFSNSLTFATEYNIYCATALPGSPLYLKAKNEVGAIGEESRKKIPFLRVWCLVG